MMMTIVEALTQPAGSGGGTFFASVAVAVAGAAAAFTFSRVTAARQRWERVRSARLTIYAQLHRIAELTYGQVDWILKNPQATIWVPLLGPNLPTTENVAALAVLSAMEVYEVTSFLHVYRERIGYALGNSQTANNPAPVLPASGNLDALVFGYRLDDERWRKWLVNDLGQIRSRAQRARETVADALLRAYPRDQALAKLVADHRARDAKRKESTKIAPGVGSVDPSATAP